MDKRGPRSLNIMAANNRLDGDGETRASWLSESAGYAVIPEILTKQGFTELQSEAVAVRSTGARCFAAAPGAVEERGGCPGRAFRLAVGSDCQWRLLTSDAVLRSLARVVGRSLLPAGGGSLIYYEEPGDFLELHRDIVGCELALITVLSEIAPSSGSGELLVYPGFRSRLLGEARDAGRGAATPVLLRRGESVVMLGGILPHEVTPLLPGQERIVSVMCYRF
jgi:hypothetical protein